jgi:hypothetical protein
MEVSSPFTHQERTDGLIRSLRDVVTAYHTDGDAHQPLAVIGSVLADNSAEWFEPCDAHEAHAGFCQHSRGLSFSGKACTLVPLKGGPAHHIKSGL